MSYERIMGLEVIDDEQYQKYREGMTPILESFGGYFGFDFKIAEVLISKSDEPINRVFTIAFPSENVMNDFFSDPDYLKIKKQYFDCSVKGRTTIAIYEQK